MIKAMPNKVLVEQLNRSDRLVNGIIIPDDNRKLHGIRPRWAKVYDVGENIKDVKVGEWVLLEHGRWTRSMEIIENEQKITLWSIDYPDAILIISDEEPVDENIGQ